MPAESSTVLYNRLREVNSFDNYEFDAGRLRHGRVEICKGESFTTVCSNEWDNADASVVCSQLGFARNGKLHSYCI